MKETCFAGRYYAKDISIIVRHNESVAKSKLEVYYRTPIREIIKDTGFTPTQGSYCPVRLKCRLMKGIKT